MMVPRLTCSSVISNRKERGLAYLSSLSLHILGKLWQFYEDL